MKEIRYNRSPANNRAMIDPRQLPKSWKEEKLEDVSWPLWKELLGVVIGIGIFMSIPWIVSAFEIIFGKGVGK
jgi:hypothetical protein